TLLRATLQALDHLRRGALHLGSDIDRNEQPHTCSILLTMSSAACDAWNFTCSRSPKKRNVRTRRSLSVTAATTTVPTGFSGVPPLGPAIPVTATPTLARAFALMPSAIASPTGSLTAPCSRMRSGGTSSSCVLASFEYT